MRGERRLGIVERRGERLGGFMRVPTRGVSDFFLQVISAGRFRRCERVSRGRKWVL